MKLNHSYRAYQSDVEFALSLLPDDGSWMDQDAFDAAAYAKMGSRKLTAFYYTLETVMAPLNYMSSTNGHIWGVQIAILHKYAKGRRNYKSGLIEYRKTRND